MAFANFASAMTPSDAVIIYLAIGCPAAVYFFLRSIRGHPLQRLSRTILVLLLWPGYTIWLVKRSRTSRRSRTIYSSDCKPLDAAYQQRVDSLGTSMEKVLLESSKEISVLEFREIFDRYRGLTAAVASNVNASPSPFQEIVESAELNAVCINRRNRRRLEFHQIRARNDFLTFVSTVSKREFDRLAADLAELLSDAEFVATLNVRYGVDEQSEMLPSVISLEKEVWSSKTQRQSVSGRA
jgi:hypothetical protein